VLDRLRVFLNRPLTDADRPRLFGLAVTVILLVALAFAVLAASDDAPPATRPATQSPSPSRSAAPLEPAPAPPAPAEVPSEEGEPSDALAASRADVTDAKRAARRFLAGYLPYSYGRRSARDIAGATPELRAELTRERPRAPAGERYRRPRIVLLQTEGVGRERAGILALVSDGKRRYTVPLELARIRAGWRVTDVGS
jgi:hypothetical protein